MHFKVFKITNIEILEMDTIIYILGLGAELQRETVLFS